MGFDPRAGTRSRSGAAAWAGPARAPPRDTAASQRNSRGVTTGVDADAEALSRYKKNHATPSAKDRSGDAWRARVSGTSAPPRRGTDGAVRETRETRRRTGGFHHSASRFDVASERGAVESAETATSVLVETAAPGFADQGVAKTDVFVDEDGDAANDFFLADPVPVPKKARDAKTREEAPEKGAGEEAGDAKPPVTAASSREETKTPSDDPLGTKIKEHSVRACASCALDVSGQPDVPLPPLAKGDPPRAEHEVGRWLGWCEDGCAVALCGPCATARVTPALAAATSRLEAVISGLGTGYTKLGEDDDPEGAAARDPPVRCPCWVSASPFETVSGARGGEEGKRRGRARRCASRLVAPPFAEAEKETHQTWAMAATEALFAARDSRIFARGGSARDSEGDGEDAREETGPFPAEAEGRERTRKDAAGGSAEDMDLDRPAEDMDLDRPAELRVSSPSLAALADSGASGRAPRFAICPNFACAARVLLEPPPPPRDGGADLVAERDPTTGRWLSREALIHKHTKRFRCARCATDFCGDCLAAPYHVGFHLCAAAAAAAAAPRCRYCDAPHLDPGTHYFRSADTHLRGVPGDASVRELRRAIGDVDTSWCVTKDDLRSVYALASSVCALEACRKKLAAACSKTLACGHPCGGVRGEPECLPCLRCPKAEALPERASAGSAFPAGTDPCCVCYADELKAEPCIRLGCGHVLHRRCALERIENGWPTQNITFDHLRCPLCGEDGREPTARGSMQAAVMSHPSLARALAPALALRETVMKRARRRLALDANGPPRQIQAGGDYEGRPGEYALSRFNYYLCETCESPYFGGDRACHRGGVERGDDHERGQVPAFGPEAHRLVCGSCSVTSRGKECKKGHGAEEMEYKCRYCCDVAVWFCFDTTHFCDACHTKWVTASPDWETDPPMKACTRKTCPLRVEHPEHGQEFCLGCAVCRSLKASQQE